jgi:DNA repair photolyase
MYTGIARLARLGPALDSKARVDYTELPTRRFFNRCTSPRMPFRWTLNPYRGCEFGCVYCYARYTHEFMELRDPLDFERRIFAKAWNARAFRDELSRIDRRESIALGTATDPYQPAERRYRLTRRMLEIFARAEGYILGLTTKSDLAARDAALLAEAGRRHALSVAMTITTVDARLARMLEPMAPRPDLRLQAVETLARAGVRVGVYASPAMPGINDSEASLDAVARAARDAGAVSFGALPVFLSASARAVFLPFLEGAFPRLARGYRAHFTRDAYLRGDYPERLKASVRAVRERYSLSGRVIDEAPPWIPPQMELFP